MSSEEKFKECLKHGWLSKSDFYSSTSKRKDRKEAATYYYCKICTKEYCQSKKGKESRNRLRKEWAINNPEKEKLLSQSKRKKKPDLYRDINNKSQRINRKKLRLKVLQHYSGNDIPSCDCCGENRLQFLALDHKFGDGNIHRRSLSKQKINIYPSTEMYRWAFNNNYPDMFRVLCHNCNMSIGFYGFCPHQAEKKNEQLP